ncbi:TonB-dependent Receptor Plug Domain [Chitinophaga sp. CF118]|uniref:M56 family metallopeptidase n=1 Tax=Chitinophaga sp. CF118 TaxID=1884367 RepID=UPI0008F0E4D5|nr:M56 family metallopeptidase [Chitinophaga sp. CF118]SFE15627.1 TonB-dependent Receptor Plug Domain [Chitinophaga sp. CF118]
MLIYLLKANIALTLFYLAYRFGLRRLTFYTLNRFFLLGGIICSALCPFIDASIFFRQHEPLNNAVGTYVLDLAALNARPSIPLINVVLLYVFWTGVIVMAIRFMIQLFSLWKLHSKTTIASIDHNSIRVTQRKVTPFSFLSNIYINPSLHTPVEQLAIIRHEQIHVKQWHSLDIILGELNRIFYWFNPGAWLMSTAIRENLEFITDRCVLQQGMDAKTYQYSLIKVSGIPYATAIANNFNFSHLKQRIMMMNKKKSSHYHLFRYLILGGLVGIILLSLNVSRANNRQSIAVKLHLATDTLPVPPAPPVAPVPPPPPPLPAKGVKAVPVPAPPAPPAKVAPVAAPAPSAAPVVTSVVSLSPLGPQKITITDVTAGKLETVDNPAGKGLSFRRNAVNADGTPVSGSPVYIVDDVSSGHSAPNIKAEDIDRISVLKDVDAAQQYGEDAKNGVIFIYSKEYMNKQNTEGTKIIVKDPKKGGTPLYYIDGKPATSIDQISPNDIESVTVFKGDDAIAKYGSAAVNGVVEVKLKVK